MLSLHFASLKIFITNGSFTNENLFCGFHGLLCKSMFFALLIDMSDLCDQIQYIFPYHLN